MIPPRRCKVGQVKPTVYDDDDWAAAIALHDAEAALHDAEVALQRGGDKKTLRQKKKERDAAGHKITPGAKAQAIERNRSLFAAMFAELRAGETNLTRIVERVRQTTGARISPITARRLLKNRYKLTGKAGRPKKI